MTNDMKLTVKLEKLRNEIRGIAFVAPFLVLFLIFFLIPIIQGFWMSLHSWGILGMNEWVGLKHYTRTLSDPHFYKYMWHSFYYVLVSTPLLIVVGLVLALIINQKLLFRSAIRVSFFIPYVLSVSIISFVWMQMFDPSRGLLNALLKLVGVGPVNWLTQADTAWWSIIIASVWWGVGFVMILFFAGLQEIPDQLYEAAGIDGANSFQKFFHITLPSLQGIIKTQIFLQVILGFKLFGQVQMMTSGGPGDSTKTIIFHIYRTGFRKDYFGEAAAQSFIFTLVMLLVFALYNKFTKKGK